MAYASSTLAVSAANPPQLLVPGMGSLNNTAGNVLGLSTGTTGAGSAYAGGTALWRYTSSDSATIACSPSYFTDGLALGMHIGDAIIVVSGTIGSSPTVAFGVLTTTNSTAGFNVAVGGAIQSS